jgi:uncharacterized membrane protein HdeD (DUF308 family)
MNSTLENTALLHKGSWCAKLGIALVVFGILALISVSTKAANSVLLISWLMLVSGLTESVHAFYLRKSSAFFFHLVPAISMLPVALLMMAHTGADQVEWMLVFASSFTIIGVFRLAAAFRYKFPGWPWVVTDAIATLFLATLFWTEWRWLTPWYFNVAVGTTLILRGWSCIMFGRALQGLGKRHSSSATESRQRSTRTHEPISTSP